jgi:hypothetical protein
MAVQEKPREVQYGTGVGALHAHGGGAASVGVRAAPLTPTYDPDAPPS